MAMQSTARLSTGLSLCDGTMLFHIKSCLLLLLLKKSLAVSPCHCFLESSVSAYPIHIVSNTRIRIRVT
jgi:hypothetical protein